ncbi:MAG: hypothetical protein E6J74_08605 [Deltaproteobacteria bacterium]|nr:MAG: hypothetical protein E6J74_08605 [Deltaproteobacteria bacterium]
METLEIFPGAALRASLDDSKQLIAKATVGHSVTRTASLNTKNFNPQSLLKPSTLFWTGIDIPIDIEKNNSQGFTNPLTKEVTR